MKFTEMEVQSYGPEQEAKLLREISIRLRGVRASLTLADLDEDFSSPTRAFELLWELKTILGNVSIYQSALACLAVNDYLVGRFGPLHWNPLAKAQGAPGRDVDLKLPTGERLIGEIKTTKPYKKNDFGAQQKSSIRADIEKLRRDSAAYKFLFLTDGLAHAILKRWPEALLGEVEVVLLGNNDPSGAEDDCSGGTLDDMTVDFDQVEFVEAGKISSVEVRVKLLKELAAAYELAGAQGLVASSDSE